MIILLITGAIIAFFIIGGLLVKEKDNWSHHKRTALVRTGITIGSLAICIFLLIISVSYTSYLEARSFWDSTSFQFRDSIEIYGDKAAIKVTDSAFTDFKYNGYQENIASFIKDLRTYIVWYNTILIQKRLMKKSLMFNWLIVGPDDDMKILSMK